jgi:DnaJ-domain-containing protein 1
MPLVIIAVGVRFGHEDDSSNPTVPKKLNMVNEFVDMLQEQVDIVKTALTSVRVVRGSNYTVCCSLRLTDDYLNDLFHFAEVFDTAGTHTQLFDLSDIMTLKLNYSQPENCATAHLHKTNFNMMMDLSVASVEISLEFFDLVHMMMYEIKAVGPFTLDELASYSKQEYEFSYNDTSEEAIRAANKTALDVLATFELNVGLKREFFDKDCTHLSSILERLKKHIGDCKAWLERFRNCTLPGAQFLQHHLVDLQTYIIVEVWRELYQGKWFASDSRRPYDEAKALIEIGMVPLISRMEIALETYSKHHFEWCESPNSLLVRLTKLYAHIAEFAKPPSANARWYPWVSRKPRGYPWVDRKLGVHWWMPSADEVREILEFQKEELDLARRLLQREARDYHTVGLKCGIGKQAELRRIWWREKVSFRETLKQAWSPWGAYFSDLWKCTINDCSAAEARTLYQMLDASPTATDRELKQAFKRMVLKYHPDKTGGSKESNEKYREIVEAYEILKDPVARAHYDRNGDAVTGSGEGYSAYPTEQDDLREDWDFWYGDLKHIKKPVQITRIRQADVIGFLFIVL